jgi:hypothetical protein
VLTDRQLEALRGIERRLRWESPELARLFNSVQSPTKVRHRRAKMLVASSAFAALALVGPRMLSEAEVRAHKRAPLPRKPLPDNTLARQPDLIPGPATAATCPIDVVDVFVGEHMVGR